MSPLRLLFLGLGILPLAAAPAKSVSIVMPRYHEYLDGPTLNRSHKFRAGDTVYLSFEIAGYTAVEDKIQLEYTVSAFDPAGTPLVPPKTSKIAEELAQEDKKWTPKARGEVTIPSSAPTGLYKIVIKATDKLGRTDAEENLSFDVTGREIETGPELAIRNYHFYRSDEARESLASPTYRPGDGVFVRFDIVGFKLGEKNRTNLHYGVKLTNAKGDALVDVADAATESNESFYPPRFVPASFSIEIRKDTPPGDYMMQVRLKDELSGKAVEAARTFRIEQ